MIPCPGPFPILSLPSEESLRDAKSRKSPLKAKGGRGFPAKVWFRGHLSQFICTFLLSVQISQQVRRQSKGFPNKRKHQSDFTNQAKPLTRQ